MPYQNNIPLAPDQLSRSQGDINGNFQILGAIGGIPGVNNSAGINTAPGAGFNYLFLTAGANPPAGSVFANSNALYSSNLPATGKTELFVNKNNNMAAVTIPFTASILSNTNVVAGNPGWTYLPSGIIMKWGIVAVPNLAAGGTQAYDNTVPFTQFFAAFLGPGDSGGLMYSPQISAINNVQITIVNRGIPLPGPVRTYVAANVYYCVLGY